MFEDVSPFQFLADCRENNGRGTLRGGGGAKGLSYHEGVVGDDGVDGLSVDGRCDSLEKEGVNTVPEGD